MPNNYGQQSVLRTGGTNVASSTLISIANEPAPWLVTLLPVRKPTGAMIEGAITNLQAQVAWGSGGVKAKAVLDWPVNGGTFSITADSLEVIGGADGGATAPGRNVNEDSDVVFAAFASKAARSGPSPRRTIPVGYLAAGLTLGPFRIPDFARRWRMMWSSFSTDGAFVLRYRWFDATGLTVVNAEVFRPAAESKGIVDVTYAYDVPPQASFVSIQNESAINGFNVTLCFDLDIG